MTMDSLFQEQIDHLLERHFLVLYWVAHAEDRRIRYNLTNCFDDLKLAGITRTKQTALATVDALTALRFIEMREEGNRKNLYITQHGAEALKLLVLRGAFSPRKSALLEVHS